MKTKYIALLILIITSNIIFGQKRKPNTDKQEQIKSLKVAYITNELQLTPAESSSFWSVYNEFEKKEKNLKMQNRKLISNLDFDTLSESESSKILLQLQKNEDELLSLNKRFSSDLKKIISTKKILQLKYVEENFNRKLLRQYKNQR